MSFGEQMRRRREELGMTRQQLAQRLGVSVSAVGNYETGVSAPKEEVLLRLFTALDAAPAAEVRTIPLYTSPAAAGFAAPVFGEDYKLIQVSGDVPPGAELAVRIQGDSMSPVIEDGSVVYVNHDPVQSGDVGIFCVDGDMLCKQYYRDGFGMVYLFSLNRKRADMDVIFHRGSGRSLTCFGRVMLHSQPLPEGHI